MIMLAIALLAGTASEPSSVLEEAVKRFDAAQVNGDRAELEQLVADDYQLVNSAGDVEDKRQFIADLTDPNAKLNPYVIQKPIERRWADGAVMGGVVRLTGTSNGKPFEGCMRFADIWRKRAGSWQVVYTQAARAKPGDCGPAQ